MGTGGVGGSSDTGVLMMSGVRMHLAGNAGVSEGSACERNCCRLSEEIRELCVEISRCVYFHTDFKTWWLA